ncbi:hypothetical protein C1884_08815, partial [Pseudomonas sp. GW460-R15]
MDSLTISLFLENRASDCIVTKWSSWDRANRIHGGLDKAIINSVNWFEECWPHLPHYWTGNHDKLQQFAQDTIEYSEKCQEISAKSLTVRNSLLTMAEKIQLFGDSVIKAIDSTSAGTRTDNLTQAQIEQFDSSLLNIEDTSCVQSFSSYMEALQESVSTSLAEVSTFQNKISELKFFLVNKVRPVVDGALEFSFPDITMRIKHIRET